MSESDNRRQSAALSSKEILEFCLSESLSASGLREIIEQHELTPNNNDAGDVGDYDFIICAAVCDNKNVNKDIIQLLLEYFPAAASKTSVYGDALLHHAISNPNVTLNIIQLLIDAAPDSVGSVFNGGNMVLHYLCANQQVEESVATEILKLLIEKCPESVRHASNSDDLPIHIAVQATKSPNFCRMLIEAYPGSERISASNGLLPLHCACLCGHVATVQYLYKVYPDAINHAISVGLAGGIYPIHFAIGRNDPVAALEIVKFFLGCDPNVKLQKLHGEISMLNFVCHREYNDDSNIEATLEMIKMIYDAHPESIEDDEFAQSIHNFHLVVQTFLNGQLVYARQARDRRRIVTPDDNGRLPLHRALQNNVRLGSIKLLVKGNPTALQYSDNGGSIPLHIACQHHDSTSVIQYLIGLDTTTLDAADRERNTALHFACRGAQYETIAMLLEKFDAISVSRRNGHNKLPIDVLWESDAVEDRESIEYTDSVFRLLRAYPETVTNSNITTKQSADAGTSQDGKKRKFVL